MSMDCMQNSDLHHFLSARHSNRETGRLLALAGLPEPLAGTWLGGRKWPGRNSCGSGAAGGLPKLAMDSGSSSCRVCRGRWPSGTGRTL